MMNMPVQTQMFCQSQMQQPPNGGNGPNVQELGGRGQMRQELGPNLMRDPGQNLMRDPGQNLMRDPSHAAIHAAVHAPVFVPESVSAPAAAQVPVPPPAISPDSIQAAGSVPVFFSNPDPDIFPTVSASRRGRRSATTPPYPASRESAVPPVVPATPVVEPEPEAAPNPPKVTYASVLQ